MPEKGRESQRMTEDHRGSQRITEKIECFPFRFPLSEGKTYDLEKGDELDRFNDSDEIQTRLGHSFVFFCLS